MAACLTVIARLNPASLYTCHLYSDYILCVLLCGHSQNALSLQRLRPTNSLHDENQTAAFVMEMSASVAIRDGSIYRN